MDPEQAAARERDMEQVRREMYRKAHDTIRVYNPLDREFKFYFDGYPNIVKAKSTKDLERYKARLFFMKIAEYMIGQMAREKGDGLLADRAKRGMPNYLDKYAENTEVWDKVPRQDDPELLKMIADQVILGLVEEYGLEISEVQGSALQPVSDNRNIHDQIIDSFSKRIADDTATTPNTEPIKEKLALEIAQ